MEGCNYLRYNYDREYRDESDRINKVVVPGCPQLEIIAVAAIVTSPIWAIPAAIAYPIYKVYSEVKKSLEAKKAKKAGFPTTWRQVRATKKRFIFPEEQFSEHWNNRTEFFKMFNDNDGLVNEYVAWRAEQSCNDPEEHWAVKEESQKVLDDYLLTE